MADKGMMGDYPENWPEIARAVKDRAGWRCENCGDPNSETNVLTVHHLDMDPSNCDESNLVALCQVCHLSWQARLPGKLLTHQGWLLGKPEWLGKRGH